MLMKLLRIFLILCAIFLGAQQTYAQIKIGDNPGTIDPNAVLDLESTNKGFLLPRMTTVLRTAMTPSNGMMVYDTDAKCTYVYRATTWYSLCSADSLSASNGLTLVGRDVRLGGTLGAATNINTNGNALTIQGNGTIDPLKVTGLQGGAIGDSIVTVDAATGTIRKRKTSDFLKSSNIDSLVWKIDGNVVDKVRNLGTISNFDLPIITNNIEQMRVTSTGLVGIGTNAPTNKLHVNAAADPLRLEGLQSGSSADSVMTINNTGVVKKRTVDDLLSNQNTAWKTLGNSATVAAINFIGTTDNIDFVTRTNNTEKMRITAAGSVGIATATPNSTFQVAGSVATPITTQSAAYNVTASDFTVISDCSSGTFALTLPDPTTCKGRNYILIKGDATNNVLSFSRPISLSSAVTISSVNYNVRLHIQSDGTNWWLIARF